MKRFFSILLAVCLLATCVPMDTYAMVGALNTTTEAVSADSNGASVGTYKVRWIQNDHIRLYVVTNRVDKETYLVTVPARTKASPVQGGFMRMMQTAAEPMASKRVLMPPIRDLRSAPGRIRWI